MSRQPLPAGHRVSICLAIMVSACGGGGSAPVVRDASHDLSDDAKDAGGDVHDGRAEVARDAADTPSDEPGQSDTWIGTADAPMVRDVALVPDAVAMDLARHDGDRLDGSAAERSAADALASDAAGDGLTGSADLNQLDSAADLSVDPTCSGADSDGFFSSCSSCTNPGNCDSVTVGGRTRRACGCESDGDCPCGFGCGCLAIAPSVNMCGVCKVAL